MRDAMVITAKNLDIARGERLVLKGVSFSVAAGECLVLRGPNGIGKSTLLRVLAGLSPFRSGELQIDHDQTVFTGHLDAIKATLTVSENLLFWIGVYKTLRREDIVNVLEQFGLTALADRLTNQLSAGQKRRLGLARLALAGRKIWLLDEPTVSLDAEHVAMFERIFTAHCENGGVAVISSHLPLNVPNQRLLELQGFKPAKDISTNPFLEGAF